MFSCPHVVDHLDINLFAPGRDEIWKIENFSEEDLEEAQIESVFPYDIFKNIPEERLTPELCTLAVMRDGTCFELIPKQFITYEIALNAVNTTGEALVWVPQRFLTPELLKVAVRSDGRALQYVPENQITYELCQLAVTGSILPAAYIPERFWTHDLAAQVVTKYSHGLEYVPEQIITKTLSQLAVQSNPSSFRYVPDRFKTWEMSVRAVEWDYPALEFVPRRFMVPELFWPAIRRDPRAMEFIPEKLITHEMAQEFLILSPIALSVIPKEMIDEELCWVMLRKHRNTLAFMPEEFVTMDMCRFAIKGGIPLYYVPEKFRTFDLSHLALNISIENFYSVPDEHITLEDCFYVLEKDGWLIEKVPENMRSQEVCWAAFMGSLGYHVNITHNYAITDYFPEEVLTYDFCMDMVQEDGEILGFIPDDIPDFKMAWIALRENKDAFWMIPTRLKTVQMADYAGQDRELFNNLMIKETILGGRLRDRYFSN